MHCVILARQLPGALNASEILIERRLAGLPPGCCPWAIAAAHWHSTPASSRPQPGAASSGCSAALRHADQTAILIHQQAPSEGSACQHFKWRLPEMGLNAVHYKFPILNVRSRPHWPEF